MKMINNEIYLVSESDFDNSMFYIHGVFSTPEKALDYVRRTWYKNKKIMPIEVSIEAYELDGTKNILKAVYELDGTRENINS
jgi:hypothetical protein